MSDALMKGFYDVLVENDGGDPPDYNDFYDAVGGRIFAYEAKLSDTLPLAVYQMDSPSCERFFGGKVRSTATFTMTIYGKASLGLQAVTDIAEKAFAHINGKKATVASHDRGVLRGVSRGGPAVEGEYVRVDSTFEMIATTS